MHRSETPLNCVPSGSLAAACYAVRALTDPKIPTNGGCFRPISLHLPEGTLVNPREPVATGPVFAAWDGIDRGPLYGDPDSRAQLLAARNDLQRPAIAQCPAIADVMLELGALRPWLARMSGSGATCFALFDAAAERDAASVRLAQSHPHWWQMAGVLR